MPTKPVPLAPTQIVGPDVLTAHTQWVDVQHEIACLMLVSMTPDLQSNLRSSVHMTCFRS